MIERNLPYRFLRGQPLKFCTFFCDTCMTTTWKCLISRFIEDVNKRRRIFLSLSKLECDSQEINFREIRLHLKWKQNSLKKREFILKMTILLPSTSLMLKFTIDANMILVLRNFPEKMRRVGKGPAVEIAQIFVLNSHYHLSIFFFSISPKEGEFSSILFKLVFTSDGIRVENQKRRTERNSENSVLISRLRFSRLRSSEN